MKTVFVVGGAGYIGTHLCAKLIDRGYDPVVFDLGIHGNVEDPIDICSLHPYKVLSPPPIIWLASQHKEPDGMGESREWDDYATRMEIALDDWARRHRVIYTSSAQVLTDDTTIYARHKEAAEGIIRTYKGTVLRFGTVFGGLEQDPARPQTVPNLVLMSRGTWVPDDNYRAYWTGLNTATDALVRALEKPALQGTIHNVFSTPYPFNKGRIEEYIKQGVFKHLYPSDKRIAELSSYEHPTRLLANAARLPLPEGML